MKTRSQTVGLGRILTCCVLVSRFSLQAVAQKVPDPIIITIKEPKTSEFDSLSNVLIGSLGLAGILIVGAVLAAGVFAGVLFWFRSRAD